MKQQTRKHRLWEVTTSSVWLWYMTIYIKVSGGFGKNKFNSIHLLCQNDLAAWERRKIYVEKHDIVQIVHDSLHAWRIQEWGTANDPSKEINDFTHATVHILTQSGVFSKERSQIKQVFFPVVTKWHQASYGGFERGRAYHFQRATAQSRGSNLTLW